MGSFETYEAARSAVQKLARADFPVGEISIVGSNLKSVERVTGKMNAGRAALSGLVSGLVLGIFVGLLVLILTPTAPPTTLISVVLVAIGFSVLWSLMGYLLSPGKREFTSVMQIVAAHFDVVVEPNHAQRARGILGPQAMQGAAGLGAVGLGADGLGAHGATGAVGGPGASGAPMGGANVDAAQPTGDRPQAQQPAFGERIDTAAGQGQAGGAQSAGIDAGAAARPAQPATPPRTYGEAQDALRREREREQQVTGERPGPDQTGPAQTGPAQSGPAQTGQGRP